MYHLETTARSLRSVLNTLKPSIERRNTIPILGMARFVGNKVTGTNLDMEIEATIPAMKAEGEVCISYHLLAKLAGLIDADETISIHANGKDGEAATLVFSLGSYDMPTLPVSDFPSFDLGTTETITGITDKLKAALAFTYGSVSTEETRYYLNGVSVDATEGEDGKVRCGLIATDGHRLSCHPLDFDLSPLKGVIIPSVAVKTLLKMPTPKAIEAGQGHKIALHFDGVSIRTKTIDGTFPDWRRVVPKKSDAKQTVRVGRRELTAASRRLASFNSERGSSMTLAYRDDRVVVAAHSIDNGNAGEILPMAALDEKVYGEISFNAHYVMGALDLMKRHEQIAIRVIDAGSPVYITGGGEEFIVLMPMRGSETNKAVNAALARVAALPAPATEKAAA